MTRAYFPPLLCFACFSFPDIPSRCTVRPPAPPLYICIVDEHRGRRICFVFLFCLLGHDVLLLGLEAGGESYNWICRLASVVVGQGKGKGRE